MALQKQVVRGVMCEIELPDGATLESGQSRQDAGQLEGRAYKPISSVRGNDSTLERTRVEWIVAAPAGGTVAVTARHERAGVVRASIALNAA